MKKSILIVSLMVMFSGCANSMEPTPSRTSSGDPAFDLGTSVGQAIGKALWGGR